MSPLLPSSLNYRDVIAVGLMTFSLFFGAGNMILPPYLGHMAGPDLLGALTGFLLTGVGLPLLGVIATARLSGGFQSFTRPLPRWIALSFGVVLYTVIGPLFASPRTATVAWEASFAPLLGDTGDTGLQLYCVLFFLVSLWFSLYPGQLINTLGKIVTPLLLIVLAIVAVGVFMFAPESGVRPTFMEERNAFFWGIEQGYLTMDALAALAFGIVIVTALKQRGITAPVHLTRYTMVAGLMTAVGLLAAYTMLAVLGHASYDLVPQPANGVEVLNAYVLALYGEFGLVLIGIAMTLACLTTAVGLITASAEYFSDSFPILGYRAYAVICAVCSAMIASVGLNDILAAMVPVLQLIYPSVIVLIFWGLLRDWLLCPASACRWMVAVALLVSALDGVAALVQGPLAELVALLPLHKDGLAWLLPVVLTGFLSQLGGCVRKVRKGGQALS